MPSHHGRSHHRKSSSHHMSHHSSNNRRSKDRGGSRYSNYNGSNGGGSGGGGNHHSASMAGHEWSEHKSSSGKIYYYNSRTGVSQWDMPSEFRHKPQQHQSASPTSEVSESSSIRQASPHSSISSSGSMQVEPMLTDEKQSVTESLSQFFKPELITYNVTSALEETEQRAKSFAKECFQLGLNITKVSAELKMARSMVRFAEKRALVEQNKINILNSQIRELQPS